MKTHEDPTDLRNGVREKGDEREGKMNRAFVLLSSTVTSLILLRGNYGNTLQCIHLTIMSFSVYINYILTSITVHNRIFNNPFESEFSQIAL